MNEVSTVVPPVQLFKLVLYTLKGVVSDEGCARVGSHGALVPPVPHPSGF